jgi:hypothetical protein
MKRTWKRDRIFNSALGVSFAIHLSMVTLFSIVIYFPKYEQAYYKVELVESDAASAFSQAFQPLSETPENPARFEGMTESPEFQHDWLQLPSVDLPRLNFSKLEVPSSSQMDPQTRLRYKELFDTQPDDLWAQVGEKLSTVGELFSPKDDTTETEDRPKPIHVGHPAPGFDASIEWLTPPYTRQPLLSVNVDALWGAAPSVLSSMDNESVVLVFRVDQEGTVTFVQVPLADEAGVVQSSVQALKQYRFAPLLEGSEEQHGTLTIRARRGEGAR